MRSKVLRQASQGLYLEHAGMGHTSDGVLHRRSLACYSIQHSGGGYRKIIVAHKIT